MDARICLCICASYCMSGIMVSNCVFRPCVLLRVLVFLFLFVLCMRVGLLCVDRSRRQGMNGGAGEAVLPGVGGRIQRQEVTGFGEREKHLGWKAGSMTGERLKMGGALMWVGGLGCQEGGDDVKLLWAGGGDVGKCERRAGFSPSPPSAGRAPLRWGGEEARQQQIQQTIKRALDAM